MRRLIALLSALAGGAAVLRRLRRARAAAAPERLEAGPDPRAESLRLRLEESRALVDDPDSFDAGEVPVDRAEPLPGDPDARRRRLHAEARSAAEAMRAPGDDDT